MSTGISHTVSLGSNGLMQNEELFLAPGKELGSTLRNAYQKLGCAHRKFYKMDDMSRMGFICAELLLRDSALLERYSPDRIGIVMANSASSLDTDRQHQQALDHPEEVSPSPAVFVYTLPNIAIGEICIRHGITGENAFFIFDAFAPGRLRDRVEDLIGLGKIDACISGWLEKDGAAYSCFLYTVEKDPGPAEKLRGPHTAEAIRRTFDQSLERK